MNREDFTEFSGSLTANVIEFNHDAIPKPDTLQIRMTRGEHRIAEELRKQFGGFERVIIDVDGLQYKFNADGFIGLLESYERAQSTNYNKLFGTAERAARTLEKQCDPHHCVVCPAYHRAPCDEGDYEALLEWLRGDAE